MSARYGMSAREFKATLVMAFVMTAPVVTGISTPWLLLMPALIVVLAFYARALTVRRMKELD